MLKAKALCAVNGNLTSEIRPLMSVGEAPVPTADTHGNGLRDLIDDIQNIMIESVGSDEKIPEAVGQLAIKMMKNNDLVKDLLHELRQFYIRGQKTSVCHWRAKVMRRRSRSFLCFRIWPDWSAMSVTSRRSSLSMDHWL